MSRPLVVMREKEKAPSMNVVREKVAEIVSLLSKYLEYYKPKQSSLSKHAIMGPVGKLLGVLESGKLYDKDAIVGYVINVHRNTASSSYIEPEAIEVLEEAVGKLIELRKTLPSRVWIRILREIDYAVYKFKFQWIIEHGSDKKSREKSGGDM